MQNCLLRSRSGLLLVGAIALAVATIKWADADSPRSPGAEKSGDAKPAAKPKPGQPAYDQPAPVPLAEAAKRMTLPKGFTATLCAGEPEVRQPIAMAFDDRGRLWVAECYSYPNWKEKGHDRILIFEDTKGTGRF